MAQEYIFKDENAEASGKQKRTLGIAVATKGDRNAKISRADISSLINDVKEQLGEKVDRNFVIEHPELPATKKQFFLLGKLTCQLLKISSKKEVSQAIQNAFSETSE